MICTVEKIGSGDHDRLTLPGDWASGTHDCGHFSDSSQEFFPGHGRESSPQRQ